MNSNGTLTPKQEKILEFLQKINRESQTAPTLREIACEFGFKSPKAAADHVRALEKKGRVRRHGGRSRGIEILAREKTISSAIVAVPILGNIAAGYPEDQQEHSSGTLAVDKSMLGNSLGHRLFALKVCGDSMEGRGIYGGDWVVADADQTPHDGDVVVALIDGQSTLKTFVKRRGHYVLKAENTKYADLIPIQEMMIQGVVKTVSRCVS